MTTLKVLNDKFEDSSNLDLELDLNAKKINTATVHQVVKAIRAAKRTGTASTKTRAFVSGGGAKPYKQKGTGNARRGSSRSPLIRGGATLFGPMPRDYTEKVNKKVSKMALLSVLADKYQSGHLLVMEKLTSNGKTKDLFKKLNDRGLNSSLMVVSNDSLVLRAAKNLQYAKAVPLNLFNVYNALKYEYLIIEKDELAKVVSKLG